VCQAATRVVETRAADGGAAVRRRRACSSGHRLTTYERVDMEHLWVRKRGGSRQRFEPAKLRASLGRAAHKRDVSGNDLDQLVEGVAAAIEQAGGELPAERIANLCLDGLGDLDRGAYLQFAGTLPTVTAQFAGAEPAAEVAGSVRGRSEDA
jgi:transcriptional repressor NrdR